jgi:hypothetical protein
VLATRRPKEQLPDIATEPTTVAPR